jgi:hypothetical protein
VNKPAPVDADATDDAAWSDPATTKKSIQQEMDDEIPF